MKQVVTFEMSVDDLRNLIKECVDEAVQNIQIQQNVIDDPLDDFVGIGKAAKVLDIKETTLKTKTCRKEISYFKPHGKLLFSRKYLMKYIGESLIKSNKEVDKED